MPPGPIQDHRIEGSKNLALHLVQNQCSGVKLKNIHCCMTMIAKAAGQVDFLLYEIYT